MDGPRGPRSKKSISEVLSWKTLQSRIIPFGHHSESTLGLFEVTSPSLGTHMQALQFPVLPHSGYGSAEEQ